MSVILSEFAQVEWFDLDVERIKATLHFVKRLPFSLTAVRLRGLRQVNLRNVRIERQKLVELSIRIHLAKEH
ncbi:MAG TPA: hypothetical protein PKC28_05980 [Bdellovibrionales bacterium]|nr:hypothetical protein [Bdellovibrionales bacterium]